MSTVCCQFTLCGEASSKRLPGIIPAGYASQTGYQYDSISRVAGQRELAPPSKFSKLGGFSSNVFKTSGILHPQPDSKFDMQDLFQGSHTHRTQICGWFRHPRSLDHSLPELVAS